MHPKDCLLKRRWFSSTSNGIWQECHISVDSKSQDEKIASFYGFKTSVVVVSPLEYIRKQKVENVKKEDFGITAAIIRESVESTEKLRQATSTLFTAMLNNGCANKEETLRLLEGLIKYQQPSKASTWNRLEAQAHAQR